MPQDNGARDANLGSALWIRPAWAGAVQRVLTISGTVEHDHEYFSAARAMRPLVSKSWIMLPLPCSRTRKAKSPRPQGTFDFPAERTGFVCRRERCYRGPAGRAQARDLREEALSIPAAERRMAGSRWWRRVPP